MKAQINKSEIFATAHNAAKSSTSIAPYKFRFTIALTEAYAIAKSKNTMTKAISKILALTVKNSTLVNVEGENLAKALRFFSFNGKVYNGSIYLKNEKIEVANEDILTINASIEVYNQQFKMSFHKMQTI